MLGKLTYYFEEGGGGGVEKDDYMGLRKHANANIFYTPLLILPSHLCIKMSIK